LISKQSINCYLLISILLLSATSPLFIINVKADADPPVVVLNYAGNLSNLGGPWWRPPGYTGSQTIQLSGAWSDGYMINDSVQRGDYIYINATITDTDGVNNAWVNWYNYTVYSFPLVHAEWVTFPKHIFTENSSVSANNNCTNFLKAGGVYDSVEWLIRRDIIGGGLFPFWQRGDSGQLKHVDNFTDHPEYEYMFLLYSDATLNFTYDINAWTNWTYAMSNPTGDYWEYNTSGNIITWNGSDNETCKYSFDIIANDTVSNSKQYKWIKSSASLGTTRRFVQLNHPTTNISYTPYYFYDATYVGLLADDILHHDQGTDLGQHDSGYLLSDNLTDTVEERHCGSYMAFYFDDTVCPATFNLNNIYHHVWISTDNPGIDEIGWHTSRGELNTTMTDNFAVPDKVGSSRSSIYYNQGVAQSNNTYYLITRKQTTTSTSFCDNTINHLMWKMLDNSGFPSVVSNISFKSFFILNLPSNATLAGFDTDGDSINDYQELFGTFTSPFFNDTDNDGVNDYYENLTGYDPNDWTSFPSISFTSETTNVGETIATLNGYLGSGSTVTCGFWIGNVSTNNTNFEQNVTCTGTFNAGQTFSKAVTGLSSGEYYYVRAWTTTDSVFNATTNETYFITIPQGPTSLSVTGQTPTSVSLSWTNASVYTTNHTTIIKYSTTSLPTVWSQGTEGANTSASSATIEGLSLDQSYYFSAFTYINASGSPFYQIHSSDYVWTTSGTAGGNYNITIRYENTTNGLVDLTDGCYHTLILMYENLTEYNYWDSTGHLIYQESNITSCDDDTGRISLNLSRSPIWLEFRWNDSETNPNAQEGILQSHSNSTTVANPAVDLSINLTYTPEDIAVYIYNSTASYPRWVEVPNNMYTLTGLEVIISNLFMDSHTTSVKVEYTYYPDDSYVPLQLRCNRIRVPLAGERNISFYIRTDLPIYGQSTPYFNDSLIRYTISFDDKTGVFVQKSGIDVFVSIYAYNSSGLLLKIHEEFWDSEKKIYPWLVYGKRYFWGIYCSDLAIAKVGILTAREDTVPILTIDYIANLSYSILDIYDISSGWISPTPGMWVYYDDTSLYTTSVNLSVYYLYNGTYVYGASSTAVTYNFTYALANQSRDYKWLLNISNPLWTDNVSIGGVKYAVTSPLFDAISLDEILNLTLGTPAFRNLDTGEYVPWIYVAIFIIAFIILMSLGSEHSVGAIAGVGIWLMFAGAMFGGLMVIGFLSALGLIGVGFFLLCMAIIAALGGIR